MCAPAEFVHCAVIAAGPGDSVWNVSVSLSLKRGAKPLESNWQFTSEPTGMMLPSMGTHAARRPQVQVSLNVKRGSPISAADKQGCETARTGAHRGASPDTGSVSRAGLGPNRT